MKYILFGKEDYLIEQKEKKLIKENIINNDEEIIEFDLKENKLIDVISSLEEISLSFFSKRIFIIDNVDFISSEKEKKKIKTEELERFEKIIELNEDDTIILISHNPTLLKRSKIVQYIEKEKGIYFFDEVKAKDWPKYINEYIKKEGYSISEEAIKVFNNKMNGDFYLFENEVKKLINYVYPKKEIILEDVNKVVSSNISDNVFLLSNEILTGNKAKIIKIYDDLISRSVDPITIISLLSTNLMFLDRLIYLWVDENLSNDEIAKALFTSEARIYVSKKSLNRESRIKIREYLDNLYELDKDIKSSKVDKYLGLKTFLLKL